MGEYVQRLADVGDVLRHFRIEERFGRDVERHTHHVGVDVDFRAVLPGGDFLLGQLHDVRPVADELRAGESGCRELALPLP